MCSIDRYLCRYVFPCMYIYMRIYEDMSASIGGFELRFGAYKGDRSYIYMCV